jgi:hypothetical protein
LDKFRPRRFTSVIETKRKLSNRLVGHSEPVWTFR